MDCWWADDSVDTYITYYTKEVQQNGSNIMIWNKRLNSCVRITCRVKKYLLRKYEEYTVE